MEEEDGVFRGERMRWTPLDRGGKIGKKEK